jgi:AraC family transcriptional regulator, regulatory protein of adaptative response / methylated-DNA-[protein]-cysteine methyltransferase
MKQNSIDIAKKLCKDYTRIETAIRYINTNFTKQPGLSEIANHLSLSEYHFQRLFSRWVGVSPKKYLQCLTIGHAKAALQASRSLLDTALDSGLSGSSRLHDLFVNFEAMTPGEYKTRGKDIEITYGFYPSPFGEYLIAVTHKGICGLIFVKDNNRESAVKEIKARWTQSVVYESREMTKPYSQEIWDQFMYSSTSKAGYFVKGTPFQIKVWQALLRIPMGTLVTYRDIAIMIGMPTSIRAAANAIAKNSIAFLIPCHRVINTSGALGKYRWGSERKAALIGWELLQASGSHGDSFPSQVTSELKQ